MSGSSEFQVHAATRQRSRRPAICFLVLLLVNLMWAFQFSGAKLATARLGPTMVATLPMVLATLCLLLFFWLERRGRGRQPLSSASLRDFILLAVFGSVPAQLGLVWGVNFSLASNASVLTLTIPVITAVLAAALLGERMTALRWISFLLAIAGVLIVSDIDWRSIELFKSRYLLGNLLILGSCLGSAFYNSFSKKVLEHFGPVEVLTYSFVVTDVILLALVLLLEPSSIPALRNIGSEAWLALLGIAVFSLAISMILFFWVIQRIEVTQASLSIYLLPVFGVLLSSITLHEKITARLLAGGALVVVSTFLVTTCEESRRSRLGSLTEKPEIT